jgi:hypothetical protein
MRLKGRIAFAALLVAAAPAFAGGAPCAHQSAVGMKARLSTMRDQMDRIEVTADRAEQRKLMELNIKHVREGLHELRKREDIPMACRVEMMSAMLETMVRHEAVAQELQER